MKLKAEVVSYLRSVEPKKMKVIKTLCDRFPHYRLTETRFEEIGDSSFLTNDLVILDISLSLDQDYDHDFNFFKHSFFYGDSDEISLVVDKPTEHPACIANFFALQEIREGKVEVWLLQAITNQGL